MSKGAILAVLAYLPLIESIVDDFMDCIDPQGLQTAILELKDAEGLTTDEAQQALAKKFDEAIDFAAALQDAGVPGEMIGDILEFVDYHLFYMAIKVRVKHYSRKRGRNMIRFQRKLRNEIMASFDLSANLARQ